MVYRRHLSSRFHRRSIRKLVLNGDVSLTCRVLADAKNHGRSFFVLSNDCRRFLCLAGSRRKRIALTLLYSPKGATRLSHVLLRNLATERPKLTVRRSNVSPSNSPILFNCFYSLPHVTHFGASLRLSRHPNALVYFSFRARMLHDCYNSQIHFRAVSFAGFRKELFPWAEGG